MGQNPKIGRVFLSTGLILSVAIAAGAQVPGRGRYPRLGKGGNQSKLGQRAGQRAEQRAQRRAEVQQEHGKTAPDQPKSPAGQDAQRNRTTLEQQQQVPRPGQNQPPAGRGRPAVDRQDLVRQQILRQIGLNQEQQDRMGRIRVVHDDEIVLTGRRIRQAQRGLDEAIMNPQYNEAEINRRIEDLAQAHADQVRLRQRIRAEIRQVLTPEQVMKFNQVQREMQQKQQELKRIQMQQTSSPSGDQSLDTRQPALDMVDVFIARAR